MGTSSVGAPSVGTRSVGADESMRIAARRISGPSGISNCCLIAPTALRTIFHTSPVALPLLAPCKREATGLTNLFRKILFSQLFEHPICALSGKAYEPSRTLQILNAKALSKTQANHDKCLLSVNELSQNRIGNETAHGY